MSTKYANHVGTLNCIKDILHTRENIIITMAYIYILITFSFLIKTEQNQLSNITIYKYQSHV